MSEVWHWCRVRRSLLQFIPKVLDEVERESVSSSRSNIQHYIRTPWQQVQTTCPVTLNESLCVSFLILLEKKIVSLLCHICPGLSCYLCQTHGLPLSFFPSLSPAHGVDWTGCWTGPRSRQFRSVLLCAAALNGQNAPRLPDGANPGESCSGSACHRLTVIIQNLDRHPSPAHGGEDAITWTPAQSNVMQRNFYMSHTEPGKYSNLS